MAEPWNSIQVEPEKLIKAVKNRPALYDKEDPTYHNNRQKKSLYWNDVCKELIPTWDKMRPQEKVECSHEIQKRWKSLRTCFGREVAAQKKESLKRQRNIPIKRRKTYGYFDMMSFLLPSYNLGSRREPKISDDDETNDNIDDDDNDDNNDDPLDTVTKDDAYELPKSSKPEQMMLEEPRTFQQAYGRKQHSDRKVVEYFKEVKKDEDDEDKQFLMSLLPTLRKLNDKQRFEARIEILKVLKEISFQEDVPRVFSDDDLEDTSLSLKREASFQVYRKKNSM